MNRGHVTLLRDTLLHTVHDEHFDMDHWGSGALNDRDVPAIPDYSCGASACMAGWCVVLERGKFDFDGDDVWRALGGQEVWVAARRWLDIDSETARILFHRSHWPIAYEMLLYDEHEEYGGPGTLTEREAAAQLLTDWLDGTVTL